MSCARILTPPCVVALVLLAGMSRSRAEVEFHFGGQIASDLRYRLAGEAIPPPDQPVPFPSQQRLLRYGFSRNENLIKAQLSLGIGDRVRAVADVDFIWYGYSDVNDIDAATLRERVDPYRLEAHAAYIDIYRILPRLDLRIGRQVVVWGTADKFNPTNNVNTLDLSDPLLFGRGIANNMVRLDWNPIGDLIVTAVWVPIFRPARLPRTARFGLTQVERPAPVQEASIRGTLGALAASMPPTQINVFAMQPETSIENTQVGLRVAGRLFGLDLSLSYYHGRFGIPTPAVTTQKAGGVVDVAVMWPRMDVVGLDLAGSIEKLRGLGYWLEAAVIFPQEITYAVYNDSMGGHDPITWQRNAAGTFDIQIGGVEAQRATVIPSTPFVKLTAGVDFSWNKYLYTNVQYVHGFIDEFGTGQVAYARPGAGIGDAPRIEERIGDYLVAGADLKLFSDVLLIRFFGAFKVPSVFDREPKFTAVLFPQIVWAVWDATELSLGAFAFLGARDTKFGDPTAGASQLFMQARFTY